LITPKQLLKIAGEPILEHTVAIFEEAPVVHEIVLMLTLCFVKDAEAIVRKAGFTKVFRGLPCGTSRNATTQLALYVLADCVTALDEYAAVDVAIPSSDTIIEVDDDIITEVPPRSRLRRGQTPQGFRLGTIREAYAKAWEDPEFEATDDCTVVLRYLPGT